MAESCKPQLIFLPSPITRRQNHNSESFVNDDAKLNVTWNSKLYTFDVRSLSKGMSQMCLLKPYSLDAIDKHIIIAIDQTCVKSAQIALNIYSRIYTQARSTRTSSEPKVRVMHILEYARNTIAIVAKEPKTALVITIPSPRVTGSI